MTRNSPDRRRTPEQIRAASRRLGFIMLAIAAVFFVSIVVRQWLFGGV
ncbi:cytochrome oxidase small assembly protein [Paraburkholderia caballeronis]|nr:cytochrome oxidase small assembly protein [Paraburkholderia caballeronis]